MKKIKNFIIIGIVLLSFNSCTSFDDKVKEYAAIKSEIDFIYNEIAAGTKEQEVGVAEISDLDHQLESFDIEVVEQYFKEEEIRQEIEVKKRKFKEKFRADSIKQARIDERKAHELKQLEAKRAREEEARLKAEKLEQKREVAVMIAAEEEANLNAYRQEVKEKGMFLVEFDGEYYEVNQNGWNEWKKSENYDSAEAAEKYREMFVSMGSGKANELAGSLYRTVSNGIAREGISFKAIQGIQVYNVLTTGENKFD